VTNTAVIECREALAMPSRADRAVVLRRIVACQGTARIHCRLRTLADFGTGAVRAIHREGDTWIVEHDPRATALDGGPGRLGLSQHGIRWRWRSPCRKAATTTLSWWWNRRASRRR